MNRIVITGATGFLAKKFINTISSKDCQIVAVVRKSNKRREWLNEKDRVEIVELDLQDYIMLGKTVGEADVLVHFAWDGTRGTSRNDHELQLNNYKNSICAVNSMLEYGCKKIVLSGSQAEYGCCNDIIYEEMESKPCSEYGKYKYRLFLDAYDKCMRNNANLIEPRYFSLFGPEDNEETLIISSLRKMMKNEDVNLTDCTQIWNYLFVEDAAEALVQLCFENCDAGIYNVASDYSEPLKNYVEKIKKITNSTSVLNYGAIKNGQLGFVNIQPSIDKILKTTKWKPQYSFESGIKKTIEWISSNK